MKLSIFGKYGKVTVVSLTRIPHWLRLMKLSSWRKCPEWNKAPLEKTPDEYKLLGEKENDEFSIQTKKA